jgi:hypothetical protein
MHILPKLLNVIVLSSTTQWYYYYYYLVAQFFDVTKGGNHSLEDLAKFGC